MSFFALDCFHMNTLGHRAFAIALWNNMVSFFLSYQLSARMHKLSCVCVCVCLSVCLLPDISLYIQAIKSLHKQYYVFMT